MPDHHRAHEWPPYKPGNDVMTFYPRAFAYLRTTPIKNEINIKVSTLYYLNDNKYVVFGGGKLNLTNYIPDQPHRVCLVLVYLNTDTNTLGAVAGTPTFNSAKTMPRPPDIPDMCIPSALVRLKYGQLKVSEKDITDARAFLQPYANTASRVKLDTTNFDNLLSSEDDTVQKALDTLDDIVSSGSDVMQVIAGQDLSAGRAVFLDTDGLAYYADQDNLAHKDSVLGVTVQAILTNDAGNVQVSGMLVDENWNFTSNNPLFVGMNGDITQTVPETGYICKLGWAMSQTVIFIRIKQPILLGS
jgi:hypothetical protein